MTRAEEQAAVAADYLLTALVKIEMLDDIGDFMLRITRSGYQPKTWEALVALIEVFREEGI